MPDTQNQPDELGVGVDDRQLHLLALDPGAIHQLDGLHSSKALLQRKSIAEGEMLIAWM